METWVQALGLVTSRTKLQVWAPGGLGNRAGACTGQRWLRRGDKQSHKLHKAAQRWGLLAGLGVWVRGQADEQSTAGVGAKTRGWSTHAQCLSQSGTSGPALASAAGHICLNRAAFSWCPGISGCITGQPRPRLGYGDVCNQFPTQRYTSCS